jgi:hypothetical protein
MMQTQARQETRVGTRSADQYGSRRDRRPRLSGGLQAAVDGLNQAIQVFCLTLREIFDESAYSRFLARQNIGNSSHAYAAFLRDNQKQRERRPRCC